MIKEAIKAIVNFLYKKPLRAVQKRNRNLRNKELRSRLRNTTPSIIGDNCNVGVIYHDLGLQFRSPTINLYIYPDDYIKFLGNLKYYVTHEVAEAFEEGIEYPIGQIDDIKVYFMHYKSFDEAKRKWEERCKRIDFDNLYVMMTKRSSRCTEEHIRIFDGLPYLNKVLFTNKEYPRYKSTFYIKGFENKDGVPILLDYESPKFKARRYLERFDIIAFLNH